MRTTTPDTESAGRGAGRGEGLAGGAADGGCVACKSGTNGAADFDRHLRRFFWRAAGVSRRDPGLALLFARAAVRQRKAAARRRGWRQQGVQTQPLLFMSVTRRGGLRGAAEIHEALAEAADLGVAVVVLGGEPLARPELAGCRRPVSRTHVHTRHRRVAPRRCRPGQVGALSQHHPRAEPGPSGGRHRRVARSRRPTAA